MKTIRHKFSIGAALAAGAIVWFLYGHLQPVGNRMSEQARRGVFDPFTVEQQLLAKLQQAQLSATEARQLKRDIEKVREKANKTFRPSENPGDFHDALARLKVTKEGDIYPKDYKIRALRKARRRTAVRKAGGDALFATTPLPWQERGPGNVSGRSRAAIVDFADPTGNTWFIVTTGGGVWKTNDAGATWQLKSPELTVLSTSAIAQSKSNPDVIYVGTGMGYGRVVELVGNGIWKSIDHGETWTQLASTANGELLEAVNRIVVDPQDENIVLACTNDSFAHLYVKGGVRKSGIFKSVDGGQSWRQLYDSDLALGTTTDNRIQQIVANPENFSTLYASVNEVGVIKSTDAGETWFVSANNFALPGDLGNPTSGGFGLAGISVRIELAIAPTDTARIYAAVERPRGIADLMMSVDAGASWALVNDTGGDPNWFNSFGASGATGAYTAGWFDNTIAVHPFDENVVFVGGVNIYRLDIDPVNNLRTSTLSAFWLGGAGVPSVHADHHDLKMIPVNATAGTFRILQTGDGGVAHSPDGGVNWTRITGQNTTQFYGADKKPGEDVYIGGMQDNNTYVSPPNPGPNSNWAFASGGDGFEAIWSPARTNEVIGSAQNGNYFKSRDGGVTFTPLPAAKAGAAPFISKIAGSDIDPDLIFTIGLNGVNRSDDFGESWVLTPIQGNWIGYRPFDNVEVSVADPQVVWISSRLDIDPPSGLRGGNHVSSDGGLTFSEISANFPTNVTESSGIGTHPLDRNTAYYLFSAPGRPKVLKTTDLGQTWQDISGFGATGSSSNGFPDVAAFSLLVMPFNPDIIWVGTEIGLFISEDGGLTWDMANNGLPTVSIFDMKIVDDQVVVATYGLGVWSVTLPELAGYSPPQLTLAPRLRPVFQDFSTNAITIPFDLRSGYDSTTVFLDGTVLTKLGANAAPEERVESFMPSGPGTFTLSVSSYKEGRVFSSASRSVTTVILPDAVTSLEQNFDDAQFSDFLAQGLSISTPAGFNSPVVSSPHPYPNGTTLALVLTTPVIISTGELSYDEIAIVEPGVNGVTDYRNTNFFDFCVVEGSKDGLNWKTVVPGYDARDRAEWLTAFNTGATITPALFQNRSVTIPDSIFAPGDTVFFRFRLFADAGVAGWGWAIDNLQVQPGVTSVADGGESVPRAFSLAQNYPNPFNPTTTINYTVAKTSRIKLNVYNIMGQHVRSLLADETQSAGTYSLQWDGRNDLGSQVASGTYIYRIEVKDPETNGARQFVRSRKMLLLK